LEKGLVRARRAQEAQSVVCLVEFLFEKEIVADRFSVRAADVPDWFDAKNAALRHKQANALIRDKQVVNTIHKGLVFDREVSGLASRFLVAGSFTGTAT
jgi:hypothetical protein